MLGEKIKQLRTEKGYTQKDLADKLFVTAQAVSRWEKNEVEPSVSTLTELAKIFSVSVDNLLGCKPPETKPIKTEEPKAAPMVTAPPKPVLAVCEQCNRPIYNGYEIVRNPVGRGGSKVICSNCNKKNIEHEHFMAVEQGLSRRKKAYWWSSIISITLFIISLCLFVKQEDKTLLWGALVVSILAFPFVSCLFLQNNFIADMVLTIMSWGFVRFPGLIFTLDLDGIIWLLTVKLAFWILGFIIATIFAIFGVCLGLIVSVFVYPFALKKNYKNPEKSN